MAVYDDREHYIPLRSSDMLQLLLNDSTMSGKSEDRALLERFQKLTGAIFHFEYFEHLEKLKELYGPFDPDRETVVLNPTPADRRAVMMVEFFEGIGHLLGKANYTRLDEEAVKKALEGASDWGINMDVDLEIFERYEIWVRGDLVEKKAKRHWLFFWTTVDTPVDLYKRFILVCKLRKHPRLSRYADTEKVYIKVVKDIPKLDLEMMIPGGRILMPTFQKILLFVPMILGGAYILFSVAMALLSQVDKISSGGLVGALTLLLGPLAVLAGFALKQYTAFNTTKQKYTLMLSEHQYFQTLDNNLGVLTRLLDEAEEQEVREVVLGYFFLWKYAGPEGWTEKVLDDTIEKYVEEKTKLKVDFEIGDSLEKLVKYNLARKVGDRYVAEPIEKALESLDSRWDNYFQYNQS